MDKDERTQVRGDNNPARQNEAGRTRVVNKKPTHSAAAPASPAILNQRFVLEEEISRGGMGVVYKALDLRRQEAQDREEYVAVKVIGEAFLRQYDNAFISLQREARKAQNLAHPNIITVYDFDRDGDTVYMTMEYLEGQSLEQLLLQRKGEPLPLDQARSMISAIGQALSYAHQQGVIHSDIKPDNLFITSTGRVKVLDFGIATAMYKSGEEASATLFNPRQLGALTTAYAPVEMFSANTPDPRDDVYAFAVVCYEILAGRHPFDKKSTLESLRLSLKPAPIKQLTKSQWTALENALQFQREKRTPRIDDFVHGLLEQQTAFPFKLAIAAAGAALVVAAGSIGLFNLIGNSENSPPPQQTALAEQQPESQAPPPKTIAIEATTAAPAATDTVAPVAESTTEPEKQPPENRLSLALTPAHPQYTEGEKLWFYAAAAKDSFLTCYYDDTQEIIRIFPNRFQTSAYIQQGQRLEIPNMTTNQGFDITLDKANVTERILCLTTPKDISGQLPKTVWGTDLQPLPVASLDEITRLFKTVSTEVSTDTLEIPVGEKL